MPYETPTITPLLLPAQLSLLTSFSLELDFEDFEEEDDL